MPSKERRAVNRVEILGDLPGEIMVFNTLTVSQISRTGVQIETDTALPIGSLYDLRLTLGARSVVGKGRVAHSSVWDVEQDRVTYRSGIEFVEVSRQVAAAITDFVEALTSELAARPSNVPPVVAGRDPDR